VSSEETFMTSMATTSIPAPDPLLRGRILPTLARLALPNVLAMTATVVVGIAETSYIGILGTEPLAAMALVFPFAMLTQMMSAGAMGGGVSSAVSRALGSGDVARARALTLHAVAIGIVAGLAYSLFFLMFGPALYRLLGGDGRVLAEAVRYSNVLFSGAVLIWLANSLASVLRGTGNMRLPSITIVTASLLQIVLGGSLGLGLGPLPRLGMPGVALGQLLSSGTTVAILLWYLRSGRGRLRLAFGDVALRGEMFFDILKVGALACLSPVQSILTVLIFTAIVARFGVAALAGYGIGARLEFLLIPIAFGVGVAAVPMVGMAIGAGEVSRARRVARTAGGISALMLGLIGLVFASVPELWAGLFTRDPAVLAAAGQYLRLAGPGFAFFGLGLTLYFAAQGSGNVLGPVLASTLRLLLVAAGGAWVAHSGAGVSALFALVGASMTVYGLATSAAIFFTPWGDATAARPATA
jgi:putative MATE family efflux protein